MFSGNGGTSRRLSEEQIKRLSLHIDKGVADTTLSPEAHAAWVRMRAKLDRITGDTPLRNLLGDFHERHPPTR